MNHYHVKSPFGDYIATGNERLEILLSELRALQTIEELSNAEIVFDSVSHETVNIVTGPAQAIVKAGKVLLSPSELFDTIIDVPVGVYNFFGTVIDKIEGGSDTISDAVKEAEEEVGGSNLFETSSRVIGRAGKRLLGYQARHKKWLNRLQVDPYSSNQLLLDRIERIAWLETSINFSFNFVPGINGIVIVSRFNRYHKRVKQIADYDNHDVLKSQLWLALTKLNVPERAKKKFFKHKNFTTTNRFRIVESLKELTSLENPGHFIEIANTATDSQNAYFYATLAEQLEEINKSGIKIKRARPDVDLPAFDSDQETLVVLPADYLSWTKSIALAFLDLKDKTTQRPVRLWTSAALSPLAQSQLAAMDISISPLFELEEAAQAKNRERKDSLIPPQFEELLS